MFKSVLPAGSKITAAPAVIAANILAHHKKVKKSRDGAKFIEGPQPKGKK